MTYVEVDWDWVDEQLKSVGAAGTPIGIIVGNLLESLETEEIKHTQLKDLDKILEYVGSLFRGEPIYAETDTDTWLDLRGGDLVVRDIVRIKKDAYTGAAGAALNGKRGRVISMRNGKITVVLDGSTPNDAKSHDINLIQKLEVK